MADSAKITLLSTFNATGNLHVSRWLVSLVKDPKKVVACQDVDAPFARLGTVYLQCGWKGDQWGETEWCQKVFDKTGIVNAAIISQCDLLQPYEKVDYELQQHMKYKNFRGIRFLISNGGFVPTCSSFLSCWYA